MTIRELCDELQDIAQSSPDSTYTVYLRPLDTNITTEYTGVPRDVALMYCLIVLGYQNDKIMDAIERYMQ